MLRGRMVWLWRIATRMQRMLELRMTPLGRVIAGGMLAAGAFGIDVNRTAALQIAAMCAGLLVVALPFAPRLKRRVQLQRDLPRYATVGVPLTYRIRIRNLSTLASLPDLGVVDELDPRLPTRADYLAMRESAGIDNMLDRMLGFRRWLRLLRQHRGAFTDCERAPPIPPGSELHVTATLLPLRRGYIHFASTVLQRTDPLGLFHALTRVPTPAPLLVLPQRYRMPELVLGSSRRHQAGGLHQASNVGDTQEFLSLRDYCRGDPMRYIHWRSWAKTGTPIVKQFQDEYCSRQALVLDTFADSGPCFEAAVSIAASLALGDQGADTIIDLMFIATDAVQAQTGRGLGSRTRLLELLACAQPASTADFAALSRLVLQSAARLSGAVLVLLDGDEARRELLRALQARRVPLLAILVSDSPEAERWAATMRADACLRVVHPQRVEEDLARLAATTRHGNRAAA